MHYRQRDNIQAKAAVELVSTSISLVGSQKSRQTSAKHIPAACTSRDEAKFCSTKKERLNYTPLTYITTVSFIAPKVQICAT